MMLRRVIQIFITVVITGLIAAVPTTMAFADAPGTRGDETQPQGSTASSPHVSSATWDGVQMLQPLAAPRPATMAVRTAPLAQNEGGVLPWLSRELNPGNWILDAGMGIISALFNTLAELVQQAAISMMPGSLGLAASAPAAVASAAQGALPKQGESVWSILPSGCGAQAGYNFVFCTPGELTYAHPNMHLVWNALRPVALALVTLLFAVRLLRLISEGPVSLASEGKSLLFTFLGVSLFVSQSRWVLETIIEFFNGLSNALLAHASSGLPATNPDGTLNAGAGIMYLVFWLIVLFLVIKSFFRLIHIAILVGVAPLAGALLMDRATAPRFRSWLDKLIELLTEQVALVLVFILATAMLEPFQNSASGPWDSFVNFLFGTVTLLMALVGGPAVVGFARAAPASYLQSRVQLRAMGLAGRGTTALARRGGAAALGSAAAIAAGAGAEGAAEHMRRAAGWVGGARPGASGGDPRASAAAARISSSDSGKHGRVARDLRERARLTSETGDADRMRRRADALDRYTRNGRIAHRPGRYGTRLADGTYEPNAVGLARRTAFKNAQTTAAGMLAVERGDLMQRIGADTTRLAALRERMARAQTTGEPASRLQHRYGAIEERLEARHERLRALDPGSETGRAQARRVALAIADQSLPPEHRRNRPADQNALQAATRGVARASRARPVGAYAPGTATRLEQHATERAKGLAGRASHLQAEAAHAGLGQAPKLRQQAQRATAHAVRFQRRAELAARAVKHAHVPRRERRLSPAAQGTSRTAEALPARNITLRRPRPTAVRTGRASRAESPQPNVPGPGAPAHRRLDARSAYRRQVHATIRRVRDGDEEPPA
jgi:hypothetical protein